MDLAILLFIVDMSMKYRKFRQYRSVDEILSMDCNLDQQVKDLSSARIGNLIKTKGLRPLLVS